MSYVNGVAMGEVITHKLQTMKSPDELQKFVADTAGARNLEHYLKLTGMTWNEALSLIRSRFSV